jgi:hypothetical protein
LNPSTTKVNKRNEVGEILICTKDYFDNYKPNTIFFAKKKGHFNNTVTFKNTCLKMTKKLKTD